MTESLVVALPDERLIKALDGTPGAELVLWDMKSEPPRQHFDIVVPPYLEGPVVLDKLRGVSTRLVQWQSIGFDGVPDYLPSGTPLANASTVHETSTAELAVGLALAMQRGIPDAVRDAQDHNWAPKFRPSLADQRVLLVGYGGVSKAIESRLIPFEVQLTRVASSAREERNSLGDEVHVHGIDELRGLVSSADIVIIGLPLNDSTRSLFDAEMLAAMPQNSLLINVGRGGVVDTDALVAALQLGMIRAALDVVDPEPLPEGHALWDCPGVLITPHGGGDTTAMLPRVVALIQRQIRHLQEGEEPENLVL